jgi:hypothetical protein
MPESRNPDDLRSGPVRQGMLPPELVHRVETICSVLADVFPMSAIEWIDNLQRDLVPEHEVLWWERVAGCYVEFTAKAEPTLDERKVAFKIIFTVFSGVTGKDLNREVTILSEPAKTELAVILRRSLRSISGP